MFETYEEKVGKALNTLYSGSLFLSAGDEPAAERLLVETVSSAFHDQVTGPDGSEVGSIQWFEGRLAVHYFTGRPMPVELPASPAPIGPGRRLTPASLQRSVATVPTWARPAIWLVLLREWSYASARDVLDVPMDALHQMLEYRKTLARQLSGRPFDAAEGARG